MKSFLFLLTIILLFSAIMYPSQLPTPVSNGPSIPTQAMWVEREQAFLGDTIRLHFKTPHPPFLGVIDPNGHFFYLTFPASESVANLSPLIDSKVFERVDRLDISTTQLKADPYKYGVLENQLVFTQSGSYTFLLGDNLHTDDPTELYRVNVLYKHLARPASPTIVSN